jgi:hypothetical protein
VSKLHCVKGYRRPEGKAACDILVDSGFTFQNVRLVDVVAKAEVSTDSGSVQEYYPEDGGRFLLRNVTCVNIMAVSLLRWSDSLTTVARIRCQVSPSAISGGPSDSDRFFCQQFCFPCQYHSTIAPYSFIHLQTVLHHLSN